MVEAHPFTFMIERARGGANGFVWIIFWQDRETQRSRESFATKREAEIDAKKTMLSLIEALRTLK